MPRDDDEDDRPRRPRRPRRRRSSPSVVPIVLLVFGLFALGCGGAVLFVVVSIGIAVKEFPDDMKKKRAEERQRLDDNRRARDPFNR